MQYRRKWDCLSTSHKSHSSCNLFSYWIFLNIPASMVRVRKPLLNCATKRYLASKCVNFVFFNFKPIQNREHIHFIELMMTIHYIWYLYSTGVTFVILFWMHICYHLFICPIWYQWSKAHCSDHVHVSVYHCLYVSQLFICQVSK